MNTLSSEAQSLTWLVNNFVSEVPGVTHAIVVSADGLLLIASDELTDEQAQQLSAVASGARSLAETSSRLFDLGDSRQTIVRMERGYLFVMAISDGSCLATLASSGCDMKIVAYQMTVLVESSGHVLTPQLRRELRTGTQAARVS
ncbi:MAG: roadblock/LC7 domain-containing protein [Actinobacteria bacterium]|nr:roadblock/LC7 domain-containing protein [Actinomycetota bacterium]